MNRQVESAPPSQSTSLGGRHLALLILAALPLLIYWILLAPIVSWIGDARDIRQQLQTQLAEYRRVGAASASLARRMEALEHDPDRQRHYLPGAKRALASAALQQRVAALAEAGGAQLISTQADTGSEGEGQVRLRVHMRSGIEGLVAVFHGLEAGTPTLFLENVAIGAVQARLSRKTPAVSQLETRFDVVGYTMGE